MRLLVVEDEDDLRRAIVQVFSEAGYAVDEADNGAHAIAKARTWDYDAIVLDLMLPQKSGWDVLADLRRDKSTPVLILTARDGLSDRVRGLDDGADDYLVKPFSNIELLARVRALIRRTAGQASSRIHIGSVVVDTAKQVVTRDSLLISLTAREYALLELLALHRGKLITRTMIYDHVFGENDKTLSNLVDVHVSNIRKKLGADFITTRRGQGYIIDG
ncbi:MAG: response regulator transcription factor [Planctomycetales bacterium]|nr:response regulator transcription factor [Planctomycetales bacterium]